MADHTVPETTAAVSSAGGEFPTMPQTGSPVPARPYRSHRGERGVLLTGVGSTVLVSVSNVYVIAVALFSSNSFGVVAWFVSLFGVPVTITVLAVGGVNTRRYRLVLVLAGVVLLLSPVVGVLLGAAFTGQPAFEAP